MSTPKRNDIHRLLDIVVEEVSLVDRAANKHRFLIVKRSDPMEENHADKAETPDGEAARAAEQTPGNAGDPTEKADGMEGESPMLDAAVEALERLTETVETLGALAAGDAREKMTGLAAELRALADRLAEAAGAEPTPSSEERPPDLGVAIDSVRATLQRVSSLLDATKASKVKPPVDEDGPAGDKSRTEKHDPTAGHAAAPSQDDPLRKDLAGLADSVRKLVETIKDQAQRLSKLEKRFGLPNSAAAPEDHNRPQDGEVGWPMDLNRPFDRENVDKAISFHDL
jgi:hypothetical protein